METETDIALERVESGEDVTITNNYEINTKEITFGKMIGEVRIKIDKKLILEGSLWSGIQRNLENDIR